MKESIDLNDAIEQTRQRYKAIPPHLRPKKGRRPISSRTPEEASALARAVYFAVKKAEESGFIKKVPGGYQMSWVNKSK